VYISSFQTVFNHWVKPKTIDRAIIGGTARDIKSKARVNKINSPKMLSGSHTMSMIPITWFGSNIPLFSTVLLIIDDATYPPAMGNAIK